MKVTCRLIKDIMHLGQIDLNRLEFIKTKTRNQNIIN